MLKRFKYTDHIDEEAGSIFYIEDKKFQCTETIEIGFSQCKECDLNVRKCYRVLCIEDDRTDRKNVVYKELKETNNETN